jgi:inosose dehydratase
VQLACVGREHGFRQFVVGWHRSGRDIKGVHEALVAAGYDGYTTLEVAGDDAVKQSYAYLKSLGAE